MPGRDSLLYMAYAWDSVHCKRLRCHSDWSIEISGDMGDGRGIVGHGEYITGRYGVSKV